MEVTAQSRQLETSRLDEASSPSRSKRGAPKDISRSAREGASADEVLQDPVRGRMEEERA
jgi:hypothetical protein